MASTIAPPRPRFIEVNGHLTYRQHAARIRAEQALVAHYMAMRGRGADFFQATGLQAPQGTLEDELRVVLIELERSGLYPGLSTQEQRSAVIRQLRASLRASSLISTNTDDALKRAKQILEQEYRLSQVSADSLDFIRYAPQPPATEPILWELKSAIQQTLPAKTSSTLYHDFRNNREQRLKEALGRASEKSGNAPCSVIDSLERVIRQKLQPGEQVDTRALAETVYRWGVCGHYNGWPARDVLKAIKTDTKDRFGIVLDDDVSRTDLTQFDNHYPTGRWIAETPSETERAAASKTLVARHRERQTVGTASAQETAMPIATQEVPQAIATEEVIPTAARTSERRWPAIPEHLRVWERPQPRGQRLRNFATNLFRRNRTEPTVQTAAAEAAEPVTRAARRPVRRILVTAAAGLAGLATVVGGIQNPFASETTQNAQGNAVTNTQGSPHAGGNGGQGGGAGSDIIPDVKPPVTTVTLSNELKAIGVTVTPDGHYRVRIENGSNPWDKAGQLVAASDPKLSGGDAKLLTAITADILTEQNKIPDTRDIPAGTPLDITSMVKAEKNAATMDIAGAINEHPPKGFSTETLQKVVKKLATVR